MNVMLASPDWTRGVDADAVLRGQGADPERVRRRSPRLVALAERVARDGPALLSPRVAWRRLRLRRREDERIVLDGGEELTGSLVARRLFGAREVVAIVATIGDRLEAAVDAMSGRDLPRALALDALGSAAVEALAADAHRRLRDLVAGEGLCATMPLSPGMTGWALEVGQPQIFGLFGLFDAAPAGVRLGERSMMAPRKSLSMIVGLGRGVFDGGRTCDHCAALGRCRHRGARGAAR